MDKTSKISLGLVLALFPIIIGAVIWVTTEITTIKTAAFRACVMTRDFITKGSRPSKAR